LASATPMPDDAPVTSAVVVGGASVPGAAASGCPAAGEVIATHTPLNRLNAAVS
jgi:hypothetical protein